MANLFLESKGKGDWWYEVPDGKIKTKHRIKFGFNEIPSGHVKHLENNPGYGLKLERKLFKILKPKEALVAEKSDEKVVDKAQELKQAKELCKKQIADLKKEHEAVIKKNNADFKTQHQAIVESRGEALKEVEKVKKENTTLKGDLANIGEKHKKELDNMKAASDKELDKHMKRVKELEDKIKTFEKQNKAK